MLRLGYIPIPRGCRPTPHFVPNARICRWVARPKGRVEKPSPAHQPPLATSRRNHHGVHFLTAYVAGV